MEYRSAHNASEKLNFTWTVLKRQIRVRPSRYGILFVVVLAAILLGSMNYNNNLGFMLAFLLGGMVGTSVLHTYKNIAGMQVLSIQTKPVFAGDATIFEIQVSCSAPFRAQVTFRFGVHDSKETVRDLEEGAVHRIPVEVEAKQRGILRPGPLIVTSAYPLGLLRATAVLPFDISGIVYPKPFSGPLRIKHDSSTEKGDKKGKSDQSGIEDFQGLKPYQPGYPLQRIYWKAFSREQGLYIKQFEDSTDSTVILDWESLGNMETENKLSRLCDMVLKANRFKMVYGLKLPGTHLGPASGEKHRQLCLKALSLFGQPL